MEIRKLDNKTYQGKTYHTAYTTNDDPEKHEMRVEMGKKLEVSDNYIARKLQEEDVEEIYRLCSGNPLYYEYCPPAVTKESVREDLTALPPGKTMEDKYFIGLYEGEKLIAVMDLIDGYPTKDIAFVGFFMTDASVQKQGVGSRIIADLLDTLKEVGFQAVRLAWVKGNPQYGHHTLPVRRKSLKSAFWELLEFRRKVKNGSACFLLVFI